jgi:hypothetical protein
MRGVRPNHARCLAAILHGATHMRGVSRKSCAVLAAFMQGAAISRGAIHMRDVAAFMRGVNRNLARC